MWQASYTGHPLYDVGLAAITAYADKGDPGELEECDFTLAAEFIEMHYTDPLLSSFLTLSLMNSDFTQPAYKNQPDRKRSYAHLVGRSLDPELHTSNEACAFTGQAALNIPLSLRKKDALPPGKAYRQHIPLVTGEGVINFSPWGDPGVPVSGIALLCLQFVAMGCFRCGGRLLAIHSDNPVILLDCAQEALRGNIEAIAQAHMTTDGTFSITPRSAKTLLISFILKLSRRQRKEQKQFQPFSITAYHLTNSGQASALSENSPPLTIYHLPMDIVQFLRMVESPDYQYIWRNLVRRAWQLPSSRKVQEEEKRRTTKMTVKRNYLYEDLFRLPADAKRFVRRYFLGFARRYFSSLLRGIQKQPGPGTTRLAIWSITELFLREVIHMDKQRIEAISQLGEQLAEYIKTNNNQRFFRNLSIVKKPQDFRTILIQAKKKEVFAGRGPLFTLESFCTVLFEEDGETLIPDWRFARDLIIIRILDLLPTSNETFLEELRDILPPEEDIVLTETSDEETII